MGRKRGYQRSSMRVRGRDGCLVPLPGVSTAQGRGLGPGPLTGMPEAPAYAALATDVQAGVAGTA